MQSRKIIQHSPQNSPSPLSFTKTLFQHPECAALNHRQSVRDAPCAHSKRLRVCSQDAHVSHDTRAFSRHTHRCSLAKEETKTRDERERNKTHQQTHSQTDTHHSDQAQLSTAEPQHTTHQNTHKLKQRSTEYTQHTINTKTTLMMLLTTSSGGTSCFSSCSSASATRAA